MIELAHKDAFAPGIIDDFTPEAQQRPAGCQIFDRRVTGISRHPFHHAFSLIQLSNQAADVFIRCFDPDFGIRFEQFAVDFFVQHPGFGYTQLIAFSPHLFDQYRQMELTPT